MRIHSAIDLDLLNTSKEYKKCVDRFQSLRCKHFHQRRIHAPDGFRLEQFEPFFEFAGDRPLHGGSLIQPHSIPPWVRSIGAKDPETAWKLQKEWIAKAVDNKRFTDWDVINELWPNGITTRQVPWADINQLDWVDEAFALAHEINSDARLWIKEFRPQDRGRWRALFAYLRHAKKKGIPVHGVAVQLHTNTHRPMLLRDIQWLFANITELGFPINVDETVIWDTAFWSSKLRQQYRVSEAEYERWQNNIYAEWRSMCEVFNVHSMGIWCPTDHWRDTWHYTDRPVWLDQKSFRRWQDIVSDPALTQAFENKKNKHPETRKPFKQPCSTGLWREDFSERKSINNFPELTHAA